MKKKSEPQNPIYEGLATPYFDDNHQQIFVGDRLHYEYGYDVIVYFNKESNEYLGKLVCGRDHSCKNTPYSLNKGSGYIKSNIISTHPENEYILVCKLGGIRVGDKIPTTMQQYLKVMAYVDGYVMARYKGCIPFVSTIKEFEKKLNNL